MTRNSGCRWRTSTTPRVNLPKLSIYSSKPMAKPDFGDAFWSLANTKSYRFTEEELAAMTERVNAPSTPQIDKTQMHFALGKAYEDSKDYDTAFSHYEEGNNLKRETSSHSKEQLEIRISTQLDVCTELFERLNVGHNAPDPIFILGLPRAGSTLLEQILHHIRKSTARWSSTTFSTSQSVSARPGQSERS